MDFHNLTPEPSFVHADGSVVTYDNMAALSCASSPRPDFEYANIMASTPIPMAASYNLAVPAIQQPMTPDPSPVDHVQIEFTDLAAPYPEDRSYKPRKQEGKAQPSTSMHMRRRAQNRASQRAFRERKEKHTQDLQRRLSEVEQQYDCLKQQFEQCQREKGELESQARHCSCGGHDALVSASEAGSPATVTSMSRSLSGSVAGSSPSASTTAAPGARSTLGQPDAIGLNPPGVGGMHDLDVAYWGSHS